MAASRKKRAAKKAPKTKKPKIGRPTKYRPEYCQMLIEHMSGGLSFETFAGVVEVNPDSLYEWMKVHKAFSEAAAVGKGKRNLFAEKMYVQSTLGRPIMIFDPEDREPDPAKRKKIPIKPVTSQMNFWISNVLKWSNKVENVVRPEGFEFVEED